MRHYTIKPSIAAVSAIAILAGCTCTGTNCTPDQGVVKTLSAYGVQSVSSAPPSAYFATDMSKLYPMHIPGTTAKSVGSVSVAMVELRGWLTNISAMCNGSDPDWHYDLEPDAEYADSIGMPLANLIQAGNIILSAPQNSDLRKITVTPLIHMELNGWRSAVAGNSPPRDWGFEAADSVNCRGVFWAYNPVWPLQTVGDPPPLGPPLQAGQYVRVVGSLVSDEPHAGEAQGETFFCKTTGLCLGESLLITVRTDFEAGYAIADPGNPARWTEVHPPDVIAAVPQLTAQHESLRAVALDASNCFVSPCATETADFDIPAPAATPAGKPPSGSWTVACSSTVLSVTLWTTIVDQPTCSPNGSGSAKVHVKVQGQTGYGSNGRFAAIYRVFWQ
jgi:hypothetical protein